VSLHCYYIFIPDLFSSAHKFPVYQRQLGNSPFVTIFMGYELLVQCHRHMLLYCLHYVAVLFLIVHLYLT